MHDFTRRDLSRRRGPFQETDLYLFFLALVLIVAFAFLCRNSSAYDPYRDASDAEPNTGDADSYHDDFLFDQD